jgi:hypothetical protein
MDHGGREERSLGFQYFATSGTRQLPGICRYPVKSILLDEARWHRGDKVNCFPSLTRQRYLVGDGIFYFRFGF